MVIWRFILSEVQVVESFTTRIQRLTLELLSLQEDLASSATIIAEEHPPRDPDERMAAVEGLKSAVDHMRHTLWGWMQSHTSPQEVADSIHTLRMQRVTEMLRALKPTVDQPYEDSTPEARSFFQEIQAIANRTVDRHKT